MFILKKAIQGFSRVMLKAGLDAHVSSCGFCGSEEGKKNNLTISGTTWYFIHHSL